MNVIIATELYTSTMVEMVTFMLYLFLQFIKLNNVIYQKQRTIDFKWVTYIGCELYLNKIFFLISLILSYIPLQKAIKK